MSDIAEFRIARLDLRPGDTLVAKVGPRLDDERSSELRAAIEQVVPSGVKVVVVSGDIDFFVLGAPKTPTG